MLSNCLFDPLNRQGLGKRLGISPAKNGYSYTMLYHLLRSLKAASNKNAFERLADAFLPPKSRVLKCPTLPETNSSPLKMDGWNTTFLLGRPIFRCYVSSREGNYLTLRILGMSAGVSKSWWFWGPETGCHERRVRGVSIGGGDGFLGEICFLHFSGCTKHHFWTLNSDLIHPIQSTRLDGETVEMDWKPGFWCAALHSKSTCFSSKKRNTCFFESSGSKFKGFPKQNLGVGGCTKISWQRPTVTWGETRLLMVIWTGLDPCGTYGSVSALLASGFRREFEDGIYETWKDSFLFFSAWICLDVALRSGQMYKYNVIFYKHVNIKGVYIYVYTMHIIYTWWLSRIIVPWNRPS